MNKPIPFGKYYLLDRINAGGMAEVFRAKAFGVEGFERIVAVKRILPSIAEDTDFITMFIDEAKIAVQLNHANIAQIFDLGKVGEAYFIALEYVHGKDLRAVFDLARSQGRPIPTEMACYVVMKTCEGLDYAHNKRDGGGRNLELVHRDVSPQNVLISFDGEVKLIDFGIARAAGKAGKTQAGILKGKFGYLSPEQVQGLPIDRRSDVFGVGIVLYELLSGQRLFAGDSEFSTIEKVRNLEIFPPSRWNPKVTPELDGIVMKALSRDVSARFHTAMELHDELQRLLLARGEPFGRRELSTWMAEHFPAEAAGDQEAVGDLQDLLARGNVRLDDLEAVASENTDVAPTIEPAAEPKAVNRDSRDESGKTKNKGTMLGMPAVLPPESVAGRSGRTAPPPPPRSGGQASIPPRPPTGPVPGQGRSVPPPPPRSMPPAPPPAQASVPPAPPSAPSVPPAPPRAQSVPPAPPSSSAASVPPPPPRAQSVPPGTQRPAATVPMFGAPASGTIPSVTARTPSSPPSGRSVPPPPGQGYRSTPPPSNGAAYADAPQSSPVLNMDWDDEELSTQIYDRPEDAAGGYQNVDVGYEAQPVPYGQASVPTYVPPAAQEGYGSPAVVVSPKAFANSEPPAAQPALAQPPVGSRAAQVTQPIVTQPNNAEKSRSLLVTGLAVAAVALLSIVIYVFLAKTEPGVVQLTTHPADAEVLFDGKRVGSASPFLVTGVAPGEKHALEVRKTGYRSWSQDVEVQPGQTLQLPVSLQPSGGDPVQQGPLVTGGFSLETSPSGAKVFLDGQELGGVTPLRVGNLVPRRYDVRVRLGGYREQAIAVEVRPGVDQSLARVSLEPEQIRVRVSSEPPSAEVSAVRGAERRALGKTPVDITLENSGTPWVLEVVKSGFDPFTQTLVAEGGASELSVRATLAKTGAVRPQVVQNTPSAPREPRETREPREPRSTSGGGSGTLRLNSRPWSQVYVDGRMIGNTPQMNIQLGSGDHRITLVNPEFRLRKNLTVTIKAGETQTQIVSLQ